MVIVRKSHGGEARLQGGEVKLVKESTGTNQNAHPEEIRNQMSLISDTEEILKFLEMAGSRSILNEHTVNCRLTACHNLFSILNTGEDNVHYMLQNLELLVNRFRNKNTSVQASTLKVYKSRLKSTLEDFTAWSKDAIAWERTVLEKSQQAGRDKKAKEKAAATPSPAPEKTKSRTVPTATVPTPRVIETGEVRKVSFPLRPDFNLEITMPADGLSSKEILKLNLFLYPYCKDIESRDEASAWPPVIN